MRSGSVWAMVLGVEQTVIERVEWDEIERAVVAHVRPRSARRRRCGRCERRSPRYDEGAGRRRWRALDLGFVKAYVEADAPRVACRRCGVTVAHVPWARHDTWFTRAFDDTVAWLATQTSKNAVRQLMRIDWKTVGRIITRVVAQAKGGVDLLDGARWLCIDEKSWRKGQQYITVVGNHECGRMIWAEPGRDQGVVEAFFDELGDERCDQVQLVSCDGAEWIHDVVHRRCKNAIVCLDPFHVVKWANDALDELRREAWNDARRVGDPAAREIKDTRYALVKNPENLTDRQHERLAVVANSRPLRRLYRGYQLKEALRALMKLPYGQAIEALLDWLGWASRSRLPGFVKLARTLRKMLEQVNAMLLFGLSNARSEAINTKIELIQRRAYGFHSPEALIALAHLMLSGLCPPLPGRRPTHAN